MKPTRIQSVQDTPDQEIEPRGAGGISFEHIFTDLNQNTEIITMNSGIQVGNNEYGYHYADQVMMLNQILSRYLKIEE